MYMIGVDIGTTSTKSVLYDKNGKICAVHHKEYPLLTPSSDIAEQDPVLIFNAVIETISIVVKESNAHKDDIDFVSFSSAMHSLILMDNNDKPLTNSITWADNRSYQYSELLNKEHNGLEIYRRTGTPIHPMSPLSKLMWFKHEDNETFNLAKKFIGIKGYVFYQLFNRYVEDYSILSATGLFNIHELDYDSEVLELLGLTKDHFAEALDTTAVISGLNNEYAQQMGLRPDTPFVIGASDGVLSNLGVDAFKPGEVAVTIGTSGAIRTVIDQPKTDAQGRLFCYALTKDKWVIGGPVNNGGVVLRWIRDEFASSEVETAKRLGIDSYQVLTKIAERVPPASNGLIFHPFLAGERAPYWNANVRGSFFGLTLSHKKEHMIRAALEGVIFNLYTVFIALGVLMDEEVKTLKATGGFAKSALWRQMMADIFEHEVIVPESVESSCLGAVTLGQVALGLKRDFSHISDMVGTTKPHQPIHDNVMIYREILPIYMKVTNQLMDVYLDMANFQRNHEGKEN
ncbi:gluconokinase [Macrococcoides caseolyticum]|uniref:gluconokinase n=1 Tax=Macrococcoides caseolyticum TaxID=69966 RepID=UPI001F344456|nr:gluconokinase [Macrococcus caseolyticus]MCE4955958.1 gluconokinase [Macrococcus caseolyticus]